MNTPSLWGKKFCHEPLMTETHPIHYAGDNTTLCGIPMLGNNYAYDKSKAEVSCPACIAEWNNLQQITLKPQNENL